MPYEKGWKVLSGGACAYEGELVAMKAKDVDVWLKPVGGTLRKRLENIKWGELVPMKANLCP